MQRNVSKSPGKSYFGGSYFVGRHWIPAFAGMTGSQSGSSFPRRRESRNLDRIVIPAKAGIQELLLGLIEKLLFPYVFVLFYSPFVTINTISKFFGLSVLANIPQLMLRYQYNHHTFVSTRLALTLWTKSWGERSMGIRPGDVSDGPPWARLEPPQAPLPDLFWGETGWTIWNNADRFSYSWPAQDLGSNFPRFLQHFLYFCWYID